MAMGGVPFYLQQAEPGLSSAQIIDKVCFSKNGLLRYEFERLFSSLFDHSDQNIKIMEVLRQNRSGVSRNQILTSTKIDNDYSKNLRKKVDVFKTISKTRKNIFVTVITTFGIANNIYSNDIVSNSLTIDCLF
jgi:hypothetical protein